MRAKFCVAAAFYFLALFVLLGRSLLVLWIKPEMAAANARLAAIRKLAAAAEAEWLAAEEALEAAS